MLKATIKSSGSFSPLLAGEGVLGEISYPKIAMPKLNGVRGVNQEGSLLARSLKPIRNNFTRLLFSSPVLANLDGELVVGDYADEEVFVKSTSGVGSIAGTPDVRWYVFDYFHPFMGFRDRLLLRNEVINSLTVDSPLFGRVLSVPYVVVFSDAEMVDYSTQMLSAGYEGIVLKDPVAKYKQGRSSDKEGIFLRYSPWLKGEAVILGINEGEINLNESVVNELGFKRKSSHKENKVPSGRAGAFTARDLVTGLVFNMPVPGVALQKEVWADPNGFIGRVSHYYYKPAVKVGGLPRFPQHKGWRESWDMSAG